jgi:hypothetical protein
MTPAIARRWPANPGEVVVVEVVEFREVVRGSLMRWEAHTEQDASREA